MQLSHISPQKYLGISSISFHTYLSNYFLHVLPISEHSCKKNSLENAINATSSLRSEKPVQKIKVEILEEEETGTNALEFCIYSTAFLLNIKVPKST